MNVDNGTRNTIYRGHLVDAYLKRAGSFRKLLITLLGFTASFGFFIAWPYLSAVQQELRLVSDIERLDAELAEINSLSSSYQLPRQKVQALKQMIEVGPPMLRDYIQIISADQPFPYPDASPACRRFMDLARLPFLVPNMPAQLQQPMPPDPIQMQQIPILSGSSSPGLLSQSDSCIDSLGKQRVICRIDRFVQFQLCEYEQIFHDKVLPTLAALQDGGTPLFDKAEQEKQFTVVREALHRHVSANPIFWHTYQGKGAMGVRLQDAMESLWVDIAARMAPVIKDLDQRIASTRERRATLKANSAALVKQRKELTVRLTRIQSPIGNLPIGLTESVLLFPIVLAIGFGMASAGLLEQFRLRRALRDAEEDNTSGDNVLSSNELAQLAPLWIEPSSSGPQRLARWLLLLSPLLAFVGTVFAVLRTGNEQAVVSNWVYGLLYIVSGLAFGVYLWLLKRGLRSLAQSCE